jgi:hypothetical protein
LLLSYRPPKLGGHFSLHDVLHRSAWCWMDREVGVRGVVMEWLASDRTYDVQSRNGGDRGRGGRERERSDHAHPFIWARVRMRMCLWSCVVVLPHLPKEW